MKSKKMTEKKICFVLEYFFPEVKGGSELQSWFIAQELMRKGWEVHYIRENRKKRSGLETNGGLFLYALPQRHTKLKWLNIFRLYFHMRKIKSPFWYCRGTISYLFPVWLITKLIGGKVIWACSSDVQIAPFKQDKNRTLIYKAFSKLDRNLFMRAVKRIDLILLQSHTQKRMLKENMGLDGKVIRNGHPVHGLQRQKRDPIILWIGRLEYRKNPEKIAEIANRLKDKSYEIIVVGNPMGNEECGELFRSVEKSNPNFCFTGELERDELLNLMDRAKLLVNTSLVEGFSNTFVEAWLRGLPVITLGLDPDNLIKEHNLGKVSGSMEQMEGNIKTLMSDDKLWSFMSDKCRLFASKEFDIKEKVIALENSLI